MRRQWLWSALAIAWAVSCQDGGGGGVGSQRGALQSLATSQAPAPTLPADVAWPELPPTGLRALALERDGEVLRPALPLPKENAARLAQVRLPAVSGAPFEVRDGAMALRVTLRDQERVPGVVKGDALLFPRGWRGSHVVLRALADGVEDFIALDGSLPPAVEYDVELSGVDGVRLVENTLEFLTKDGNPRLRMAAPRVLTGKRSVPVRVAVSGCAYDTSPRAPWGRAVTPPASSHCRVALSWELEAAGYPALLDPSWTTTGDLIAGRFSHGLVKMTSPALMLACGGYDVTVAAIASCELYNDVAGTWAATGSMPRARGDFGMAFAAPTSPGPRVLAAGGTGPSGDVIQVDLYNPATGTWAFATNMPGGRSFITASTLPNDPDGVLLVGGQYDGGGCAARSTNIFLYRFSSNSAPFVANLASGRAVHDATPITAGTYSGYTLITGGFGTCCGGCVGSIQTAELISPAGNSVSAAGTLIRNGRNRAATFVLPTGQVRIAGGVIDTATNQTWPDSELWTPPTTWGDYKPFPGGVQSGGWGTFGTLSNGNLLVAGGSDNTTANNSTAATFVYNGTAWLADGALAAARRGLTGATTPNGKVIAVGGAATSPLIAYRRTELFDLTPNGGPCTGPGLCQSGLCVDGVCCNSACGGACDACNLGGSVGTCTLQPNTVVCRASSGAACDVAETCTGASANCPADGYASAGTTCRPANGACDVAETCPGGSPNCPADGFASGTTCRPANGVCDVAETCNGSSASCPADGFATSGQCRAANGVCDVAESCNGSSANCPADGFANGTMCRAANGVCDVAETCNGTSASCPADVFATSGQCRASAGVCDVAESCNGTSASCPADVFATGTMCRAAAGVCDAPESCDGTSAACPADVLAPASTVCRPSQGGCDVVENCSGTSITCGGDAVQLPGVVCNGTYVCPGMDAGCPTSCVDDNGCAPASACVNGICTGTLDAGVPCVQNGQCASRFCVDGVCCNTACDGACDTCALAGSVGACTPSPLGNPGSPSCNPYLCDGASAACPQSCVNSSQCVAGLSCAGGRCGNASGNGVACTADAECSSGFCVDGVCCNARCGAGCDACNVPGAVGTCSVLGRGEVGANPSCAPFVCDGTNRECPSTCSGNNDCSPPAFCQASTCVAKTRGHVGFSCGGCAGVDSGPLLALAGLVVMLRRRRAAEVRR
jgi:hypothetical protein